MEIRRAAAAELNAIMALYARGRQFMRRSGNRNQWINGYPSRELVEADIQAGNSYVAVEDGAVEAVFCFFHGRDVEPSYRQIDGAWLDDGPYGVIHRLASGGRVPGMVRFCSDWCLTQCASLRIDTHADNRPMRRALERCGFSYCGVVVIEDGTERVAYQKIRHGEVRI